MTAKQRQIKLIKHYQNLRFNRPLLLLGTSDGASFLRYLPVIPAFVKVLGSLFFLVNIILKRKKQPNKD